MSDEKPDPAQRLREAVREGEAATPAAAPEELTKEKVMEILRPIQDPEIPFSIVDLGLIYGVDIQKSDGAPKVVITMTLTSPGCPLGPIIQTQAASALHQYGVKDVEVKITFDPPWDPRTMASEEVKSAMGIW